MLLVQIYVDEIIFWSTNNKICEKFSTLVQSKYGIFINQSKYVKDLLRKFDL